MKNNIELLHFLNQVQTAISHLLQDGDIADNETAQSTAKNLLSEAEVLQKKYKTCSKCGIAQTSTGTCASCAYTQYENKNGLEQKHTKECGWHTDWHNCDCGAFNK